ncbi:Endoribonuclease Nob1 [uncultured archaeon]|nr:Endoribonuclease Nob1 [uncultured archaeon]
MVFIFSRLYNLMQKEQILREGCHDALRQAFGNPMSQNPQKLRVERERNEMIYILDSNVFLHGMQSIFAEKPCVTVYGVVEEMKSTPAAIEIDRFMLSGLQILEPTKESIGEAEKAREKTQDKLSKTDVLIVALALDFKKKGKSAVIITDDYGVQNLAKVLKLEYSGVMQEGIKREIAWTGKCTACGFKTNEKICPNCGIKVMFGE